MINQGDKTCVLKYTEPIDTSIPLDFVRIYIRNLSNLNQIIRPFDSHQVA